ncbi:hypothetical protein WN51_00495 [Melipona quadrifasciata]|uniref:Uncharacterized protein n=1 Tax=Melipona quadrifasciata TaxID=166423 RepID=A0A0M9A210_9HYME|nr:hypothetical protein WN51_00495 [Melipona quadrifasciata]
MVEEFTENTNNLIDLLHEIYPGRGRKFQPIRNISNVETEFNYTFLKRYLPEGNVLPCKQDARDSVSTPGPTVNWGPRELFINDAIVVGVGLVNRFGDERHDELVNDTAEAPWKILCPGWLRLPGLTPSASILAAGSDGVDPPCQGWKDMLGIYVTLEGIKQMNWNVSPENLGHMAALSPKQETNNALDRGLMHGANLPEHVRNPGQRDRPRPGPSCPTLDPRFSVAEGRGTEDLRSGLPSASNSESLRPPIAEATGNFHGNIRDHNEDFVIPSARDRNLMIDAVGSDFARTRRKAQDRKKTFRGVIIAQAEHADIKFSHKADGKMTEAFHSSCTSTKTTVSLPLNGPNWRNFYHRGENQFHRDHSNAPPPVAVN